MKFTSIDDGDGFFFSFDQVKVWLGDNADHYYVLSRFLLSRMLTVTKVDNPIVDSPSILFVPFV